MIAIQMIGTQRSGSNLLRLMLHQLHISAPHPPHILERFMPIVSMYGDLEIETNFYNLVDDVCKLIETNPVSWGNLTLERNTIISLCDYPELVEIVRVVYELKCQFDHDQIWICKSMANIHYIKELEKYLQPFYLFLYRDGRDVALSFKKAIVGEKNAYFLAKQWKEEQDLCLDLYNFLGPKRVIMIKYEDLIVSPESQLKRICSFLRIDFNTEVMDYYHSEESKETANAGKMWENVKKPVIASNFNKYKTELKSEDIQIFEKIAGDTLTILGYQLDFPNQKNSNYFTDKEIKEFEHENEILKKEARLGQPDSDKSKRELQNNLLNNLKEKFQISLNKI